MAVAVGINLAMLGLIDRALLSPPAYVADPARVFTVLFGQGPGLDEPAFFGTTSVPMFEAIRDGVPGVTAAASHRVNASVGLADRKLPVDAEAVSGGYFAMLGARPLLGRAIGVEDDRAPAGAPVVVLSHALWKRAFGSDADIIGRTVAVSGGEHDVVQVIGVMPAGFSGHSAHRVDLWLPLRAALRKLPGGGQQRSMAVIEVSLRLAPGTTQETAVSHLTTASGVRVTLLPIVGARIAPDQHRIAWWLAAVSMTVLVIGLANAATLLVVRGGRRQREYTIKAALGATRRQLLSQVIVEAAILATASGVAALLLASWFDDIVRRLLMPSLVERTGLNARVAIAAAAGAACTFIVAAVVGAVQLPTAIELTDLRGSRRIWRRGTAQKELLIAQTTLAVLLIAGAGVFARSYHNLMYQDLGIRPAGLLVVGFGAGIMAPDRDDVFTSAVTRVRELPGVTGATVYRSLPHSGVTIPPISVPGRAEPPMLDGQPPWMFEATPDLFALLGITIVRGRPLTAADDRGAPVAVVNETMARTLWPGTDALGKCFRIGFDPASDPSAANGPEMPPASAPCREIVGVARDITGALTGRGRVRLMQYYVPWSSRLTPPGQPPPQAWGLLVRVAPGSDLHTESIRRVVAAGRSDLPFIDVRPYTSLFLSDVTPWRVGTGLFLLFGSLALTIAAAGIYAAFAHAVAERRHEMAVRIAVGASRSRVRLMLLRESLGVAAIGIVCGTIVAALAGSVVRSMFVGTSSTDPLVLGTAGAVTLVVAVLATWLPAVTASRADPNTLLRSE